MRILHFYIKTDKQIGHYVNVLSNAMVYKRAEIKTCNNLHDFHKDLSAWRPDIVHLHGCWNMTIAMAATKARKYGARIVLTPHGQLEPWIIRQHYWTEKLPQLLLYQRRCIRRSYALIAMGRMEVGYLNRLGLNTRIETVFNSVITETISDTEMAVQIYDVYRKVLDTDVMELMTANTRTALKAIIKASVSGDERWLTDTEYNACKDMSIDEWHKISVYACQENINNIIRRGISVLGLDTLPPLYTSITSYLPENFHDTALIINNVSGTDTDSIISMIKTSRKYTSGGRIRISHIIEIASFLRQHKIEEDKVLEILKDKKLVKHTARIMHILAKLTGLEEGFMLALGINDRKTREIETIITKHLKI